MPAKPRDPRLDPKVGDVLRDSKGKVRYERTITDLGNWSVTYSILGLPGLRTEPHLNWQRWAKNAVVIHAS